MIASQNGYIEIVKLLLEQKEIEINSKNTSFYLSKFILINEYFQTIFGIF